MNIKNKETKNKKLKVQFTTKDIDRYNKQVNHALEQFKMQTYFSITTKETDYLLKAIKFQVIDYLIKPVSIIDLAKAITKMKEKLSNNHISERKYSFQTFNSMLIISALEIAYCEADGNYCKMFTIKNTEEDIFERLGEVETKLLSSGLFIRAGKSYLINKKHIYKIDARKQICFLKTSTETFYEVNLSMGGFATIKAEMKVSG